MIHYYKTHWVLFAKVNARISIKSYKIAITFANNRTSATIREEGFLQMHYFAKCVNLANTCYSLQFTFSEMRVRVFDDSKHRGPFFGVSGKEVKMEKYNEQMLPKRARSQRQAVGKALEFVILALDDVRDCKACGSEVVATWLDPVELRLIYAKNYLSDAIREGGAL